MQQLQEEKQNAVALLKKQFLERQKEMRLNSDKLIEELKKAQENYESLEAALKDLNYKFKTNKKSNDDKT